MSSPGAAAPPLVAHIIHRLDFGGLENGLVNLINAMPVERYRHAIVCLTDYSRFRERIRRPDVAVYALHKRPGKDLGLYWRLWRLLRRVRPDIVHTRNLAAVDCLVPAALAGVPHRVHGEHGRDVVDLDGRNWKYRLLRRLTRPLVGRYIPLSEDLEAWLHESIGVPRRRLRRIYNGVDSRRFHPHAGGRRPLPIAGFAAPDSLIFGTVGRMQPVKDPLNLVRAFLRLRELAPGERGRLRLVLVGDGPLRTEAEVLLAAAGAREQAWLAGARDDVPELLQGLNVFVLPSIAEGISNTILEAMACGLPVVATRVGGNAELVVAGETGQLVPASDPDALARAMLAYVREPQRAAREGAAGRVRIEQRFSLDAMVERYMAVYDEVLTK
ncbi:MAG TPA: TIGR03088 family PEP-CTERM/XrtA system glycosyltransferase [Acidiferrobacterales bacterium]